MLNVGAITEGFVLDHIHAGDSLSIYHDLKLDKLDCCVAIIKNACLRIRKMRPIGASTARKNTKATKRYARFAM